MPQNSGKKRNIYYPDGSLDESKLRYVIYARKSTEEKDKQFFSIPRQLDECRKYAKSMGYRVVEELTETASAATAGNRPVCDSMIKRLETDDIDGIIADAPDRLSRNMLEAGNILDM